MREDTKKAIESIGGHSFANGKNIKTLEAALVDGEAPIIAWNTNAEFSAGRKKAQTIAGFVMITNWRIMFASSVLANKTFRSILLNDSVAVGSETSAMFSRLTLTTPAEHMAFLIPYGAESCMRVLRAVETAQQTNRDFDRQKRQQNNPVAQPETQSIAEKIEELAGLKEKGIITEEEFSQKKAELLARM